jgi:exopolyphosphatase/guanosine-5'-triphosphate,3'-diphosphate pyrophosphatase
MARIAAIDIGSNAMRLRVVDVDPPEQGPRGPRFRPFKEVCAERASVRLGHDVFTRGRIEPTVIAQACDALKRFRTTMDGAKVDRYRAVATSASREAKNGDVFVERAEREAGIHVDVIEGLEEARLVLGAVRERMNLEGKTVALIDIGGGSTELTLMVDLVTVYTRSLPVGTVRLIEAFLEGPGRIDAVRAQLLDEYVERVCAEPLRELVHAAGRPIDVVVATGGNIETLAEICPLPLAFPETRAIEVGSMAKLYDTLLELTVDERASRYGLRPDRADTIVPAANILLKVAAAFEAKQFLAPGVGLKEGVLVDLAIEHFVPRDFGGEAASIKDASLRLGRRYHFDEAHGEVVSNLAMQLFDDLGTLHGLGPRDRILLLAAALLHDIGDFVRYEGHHKHSHYVIAHSDIMGLTPAERDIVANVARYHRKSSPSLEHENFRALSREARAKVKMMASILRVADALDREHRRVITSVRARVEGGVLWLDIEGAESRALEEWTVRAKSGLLKETLGLEVRLEHPIARTAPPPSAR